LLACDSGIVGANRTEPVFSDCNRKEAGPEEIGFLGAQPTRIADTQMNRKSVVGFNLLCMYLQILTNEHKSRCYFTWTPPGNEKFQTSRERPSLGGPFEDLSGSEIQTVAQPLGAPKAIMTMVHALACPACRRLKYVLEGFLKASCGYRRSFSRILRGTRFRGYLQKQFQAITSSAGLAVLIQAKVFGVGHL
jgi:hypothetical protein